jgi:hypothetical protein
MIIVGNNKQDSSNGSPIEVTPELSARIDKASSQAEVQAIMHDAYQRQFSPDGQLTKSLKINGQTYEVRGSDAAELARNEAELWQRLVAPSPVHQHQETELDKLNATQRAQLEMEYRLGHISLSDFIQRAGIIEEIQGQQFEREWAASTDAFLRTPEGFDFPRNEEAQKWIGEWIESHGLTDAQNKTEVLKRAYAAMKEAAAEEEKQQADADLAARLAKAKSSDEINAILGRRERNHYESGYYGR